MGGQSSSTPQSLGGLFAQNPGYQQTPVAPISAPQYPAALNPSLDQVAAATRARMLARTPVMAAPVSAPKKPIEERHGGSGNGRGGLGGSPV